MSHQAVFIQVGALADGFAPDNDALPAYSGLAHQHWAFYFADGDVIHCDFCDSARLSWNLGPLVTYRATSVRAEIILIDFLDPLSANQSISLACDLRQQSCTVVYGRLPDEAQVRQDAFSRVEQGLPLTAVEVNLQFATLNRPYNDDQRLHRPTNELIGMRNLYRYNPSECYEHIYLNENFYAWHCLQGVEKGLSDVDRCYYVKLAEQLYLFIWCEKIIPTLGVVLIDLQELRTDGKIFGYQGSDFGSLVNFTMGARAQLLNTTSYPIGK